jgi:hypothetical protein
LKESAATWGAESSEERERRKGSMTKHRKTKASQKEAQSTGTAAPASAATGRSKGKASINDGRVVLQVRMQPALRREIKRLAHEADVTRQTYVLMALRAYS